MTQLCVVMGFASIALGTSAEAMSLVEAFRTAYETNPSLISGRANVRATDENVTQARAGLRPTVTATVGTDVEYTRSAFRSDTTDTVSASLDASQPLYDGGRTFNATRGRMADSAAARARLTQLEQDVLFDVVSAYMDVRRDAEFVVLGRNNVRVLAEQLRASQDRFEVGEVTRTDVSQARARLAESEANLSTFMGNLERSRQAYRAVVGAEPDDLASPPPIPSLPGSLDEAIAVAMQNHPLLVAARLDETSAVRDVKVAIGGLLPTITLDGSVSHLDGGFPDIGSAESTRARLGVTARIPIYQAGAQYSRVRQAQELASQARANITVEARNRRRATENAWSDLLVAQANIRSNRQQVAANEIAFEGVREEAIVGSRTTLDILDAEQELLNARTNLVASVRDEYVAGFALLAAMGALTVDGLDLSVEKYDPEIYYDANNARFFGYERTPDTEWAEIWRP